MSSKTSRRQFLMGLGAASAAAGVLTKTLRATPKVNDYSHLVPNKCEGEAVAFDPLDDSCSECGGPVTWHRPNCCKAARTRWVPRDLFEDGRYPGAVVLKTRADTDYVLIREALHA